jgi:hypothetical protein
MTLFTEIPQDDDRREAESGAEQWEINLMKNHIKFLALSAARCKLNHADCLSTCRSCNDQNFKAKFLNHAQAWRQLYMERMKELTRCIDELAAR